MHRIRVALGCALGAFASCSDAGDPASHFALNVAPVLQRRCAASSCHGVPPGAREVRQFSMPTDANGYLSERAMIDAAYRSARRFIDTTEVPELSSLLRKPLPPEFGGVSHAGGAAFRDRTDTGFLAMRTWIAEEHGGGEDGDGTRLSEGERFFASRVQPELARAQCMLGPCHGIAAGFPLNFDPGIDGTYGVAATQRNYAEAIVHISLGGSPEQSRLARKGLRDREQFLPHLGGNGVSAFPARIGEPLPRAIVEWARLERRLRTDNAPERQLQGIVFVGGPLTPARVVEHDAFAPGSDLFLLAPPEPGGTARNLTASMHAAPADIRNPVVDDTGTLVAFSMRRSGNEGAAIWEMVLASGRTRQVTAAVMLASGQRANDLWPAYGPDGRIWFVSTRGGTLAEHGDGLDTDLYVVEPDGQVTRRTHTPSPELATTFFRQGRETAGSVAFTAIRRLGEDYKGVVYRFPNDLHSEYHQQFGITLADDVLFHMRETADGNYAGVMLDRDAVWSAGALILVDRNLGPALSTREMAQRSLPGALNAVSFLGPYGSHDDEGPLRRATSEGAYRDPAPLPDGRMVVSFAPGHVALRDRTSVPDFALYVLRLTRDHTTGEATIASRDLLIDLPGVAETEPVPVFRNCTARAVMPAPTGEAGRLVHGGVPMLENLLAQVPASGARELRDDVRAARILAWIPEASDPVARDPDRGLYPEQRRSGASPHMPARVLGEVPIESDGTVFVELAAGTAFRLQFLDGSGMSVGIQHNRWFDINGGQSLRQGTSPESFDHACAHCHGSRTGEATAAFPVDVTARASLSLARFEFDDPDRPRAPVRVGMATQLAAEWRTDVLPLLTRSCASSGCHDAVAHAGNLSLEAHPARSYDAAYGALVARGDGSANGFRYVDVIGSRARASYLAETLLGREFEAPRALGRDAAHRGSPALTDDEVRTVVRWIESGALYCTEHCP